MLVVEAIEPMLPEPGNNRSIEREREDLEEHAAVHEGITVEVLEYVEGNLEVIADIERTRPCGARREHADRAVVPTHAALLRDALEELFFRLHHAHKLVAGGRSRRERGSVAPRQEEREQPPENRDLLDPVLLLAFEPLGGKLLRALAPLVAEARLQHHLDPRDLIGIQFAHHVPKVVERIILHLVVAPDGIDVLLAVHHVVPDERVALRAQNGRRFNSNLGVVVIRRDLLLHDRDELRLRHDVEQQLAFVHVHLEADHDVPKDPVVQRLPERKAFDFPQRPVELLHHRDLLLPVLLRSFLLIHFAVTARQNDFEIHEMPRLRPSVERTHPPHRELPTQVHGEELEEVVPRIRREPEYGVAPEPRIEDESEDRNEKP